MRVVGRPTKKHALEAQKGPSHRSNEYLKWLRRILGINGLLTSVPAICGTSIKPEIVTQLIALITIVALLVGVVISLEQSVLFDNPNFLRVYIRVLDRRGKLSLIVG